MGRHMINVTYMNGNDYNAEQLWCPPYGAKISHFRILPTYVMLPDGV